MYRFEVTAKGDLALGVGPEMELMIDGVTVGSISVAYDTPRTYVFNVEVTEGAHTVSIGFYNDYYDPLPLMWADRNLYVDSVRISLPSCNPVETVCSGGGDDDGDGLTDCEDSDCALDAACCDEAGPLVIEAEEMGYHANGMQDGDYWLLWANGEMSAEGVCFPGTDVYRFEVTAKGDIALGVGPEMELMIDGVTVGSVEVASYIPRTYTFDVEVTEGAHTVSIGFYNDYYFLGADRNLYVHKVSISSSSCSPSFETVCSGGQDDDGDGLTDCEDSDCALDAACCDEAGPLVIEGEEMGYHANGMQDGDYWLLWANGEMSEEGVYFAGTDVYRFEVTAKGDLALGVGPEMELMIDGETLDTVAVDTETFTTYTIDVEITEGSHTVSVGFYNDYYEPSAGEDRNLYVDKITLVLLSCVPF
jgi:hypothetical protein